MHRPVAVCVPSKEPTVYSLVQPAILRGFYWFSNKFCLLQAAWLTVLERHNMTLQSKSPKNSVVGPTANLNKIIDLDELTSDLGPTPIQVQQPLFQVEKQTEIDGVEMGVLENGVPYLTERGLARMCGIDRKVLNRLASKWEGERYKPRGRQIEQMLEQSGYTEGTLYLESSHRGSKINAYTEPVCLALLEYYAFVAEDPRPEATRAFRALVRITFRKFIYDAVGYNPEHVELNKWKHFHDRVDLTTNAVPVGYFSIWQEIATMIVPMIRAGIMISDKMVPDISVGIAWSNYWKDNKLDEKFGSKIKWNHAYPDYYPQSKSNPQEASAYPDAALGTFRAWLREHYIATKFPAYLLTQAKKGHLQIQVANKALEAFGGRALEYKPRQSQSAR